MTMGKAAALDGVRRTARNAVGALDELCAALHDYKYQLMKELLAAGSGHDEPGGAHSGKLPEGWRMIKLGDLVKKPGGLIEGPAAAKHGNDGAMIVTGESVASLRFIPGKCAKGEAGAVPEGEYLVLGADIVMVKSGERAGACAIMPVFFDGALLGSGCIRIVPDATVADPFYVCNVLHYLFRGGFLKAVTAGDGGIDMALLSELQVKLPPMEEQKKIAGALLEVSGLVVKAEEARAGAGAVCDGAAK